MTKASKTAPKKKDARAGAVSVALWLSERFTISP
jgi:hypothetical protein